MKIALTQTKELDFQTEAEGIVASMRLSTEAGSYAQLDLYREDITGEGDVEWGAQLSHLFVPAAARRQGEAKALVKAALAAVKDCWDEETLVVFAEPEHDKVMSREDLINFYTKCGLEVR